MPHSLAALKSEACVSNSEASTPNHGCQAMTVTPRRDSASTPNVLTGTDVAAGVAVAASAARVTMGLGAAWGVGAQAESRRMKDER